MSVKINDDSEIPCPCCNGAGTVKVPHAMQKRMDDKATAAKALRRAGFSFREIASLLNYKSPRSVQTLLRPTK